MRPALEADDRVLVTGAGGWFGSTALALLQDALAPERVLAVAASARVHRVDGRPWTVTGWEQEAVTRFQPTLVLNFAFLTRDLATAMGGAAYADANAALTRRFLAVASLPSVQLALTVSSGAAVTEPEHPYGRQKGEEERAALALVDGSRAVVVARAYSVSGPFVREPGRYAFSSFVQQARAGSIEVQADRLTYRRYCDVAEYLSVCLRVGRSGWSGVIESGGDLVEVGELAQRIARATGPHVRVARSALTNPIPSSYASDNQDWLRHCAALAYQPASLDEQIAWAIERADA